MKRKIFYVFAFLLSGMILISSCGRKKEDSTSKNENESFELTKLQPPDVSDAVVGDWVIRQEMSDAEKLNPTVTNDAAASGIYIYIF